MQPYDVSGEHLARVAAERRSKVTFDIQPVGQMVKLTVVHDDFDPGSAGPDCLDHDVPGLPRS